tara:strand:- start:1818 stop:2273 length:456 start_codon:yes stop_codon:yes gene_type:complete
MEQQYNILILNEDILNIIFINLTPLEAQNLSQTCKSLKMIYNNLYKYNQYIPLINKTQKEYENTLKNKIQKGFRYMEINNKVFKIINILEYFNSGFNIILTNGFIININNYYIKIYGYKNIEKIIDIDNIKLIQKSKFNYKLKPICISKYN